MPRTQPLFPQIVKATYFSVSMRIVNKRILIFNTQAPDQKINPQAPDRTFTSISVKTPSQTFEITTKVFEGAENLEMTLKSEIYLKKVRNWLMSSDFIFHHYFIMLKMTKSHSKISWDSLTKISISSLESSKTIKCIITPDFFAKLLCSNYCV